MRTIFALVVPLVTLTPLGLGQSFEAGISGGASQISSGDIGALDVTGATKATLDSGFRLTFRMTVNPYSHAGFEFGYAYNRTHLGITGAGSQGMAIHQGFGDFLAYATPSESRVRPFVAGGVNFSNFVPPGQTAQYGQGNTKYGINYGGGIKAKLTGPWQVRFDIRQYNTGKPFGLPNASGRLLQNEFSVGVSYTL